MTASAAGYKPDLAGGGCYMMPDFSLLPDGCVLLFESNATMLVHPEAPDSRHAGKNPFIDRILPAFEAMVMARARLPPRVPAHSPPDTRGWT